MDEMTMEALIYAALARKGSGDGGGDVPASLRNQVNQNTQDIASLKGTGNGSVSKAVSDAIAQIIDEAPETFDTLKEVADYIASDETRAAQILAAIAEIQDDLQSVGSDMDTLEGKIDHAFDNLTDSQKAELKGEKGDKGDTGAQGPQGEKGEKGDSGDGDYDQLKNKPTIEARVVEGNKKAEDLNLASKTYVDVQLGNVEALLQTI